MDGRTGPLLLSATQLFAGLWLSVTQQMVILLIRWARLSRLIAFIHSLIVVIGSCAGGDFTGAVTRASVYKKFVDMFFVGIEECGW